MGDVKSRKTPRRERERIRHREEVLETAERLLARQPYLSITVQSIAEEAEFSVGYLYKLFPSKDELYLALVEARKKELVEMLDRLVAEAPDFRSGLRQLVDRIHDWLLKHEVFARDGREDLMALFRRSRSQGKRRRGHRKFPFAELFKRGISEGVVGGADPELMARTLRALLWGFIADDIHMGKETWTTHDETIVRIILKAFSPGGEDLD